MSYYACGSGSIGFKVGEDKKEQLEAVEDILRYPPLTLMFTF